MSRTVVLITGANSGVGYACSKVLTKASEKYHVFMACRSLEKAEIAKSEIEAGGIKGTLETIYLDVLDHKSIKEAAELVGTKFGKLDALVNNAAVGCTDPDIKVRMQTIMDANVVGPALVADAFRPLLLKAPKPYSVYVTSGLGSFNTPISPIALSMPYVEVYMTSKSALNRLAVEEWRKYESEGLKTFAMCPGFVVSNLRGTSEEERTAGGIAGDADISGQLLLDIIEGNRDADVGKLVKTGGTYPW